jgi:uncharacterized membrane protein YkvA (DUF1232 family)
MSSGTVTTRMGWVKTISLLTRFPSLIRLCWRLFRDSRVSIWPKALLVAALAYVVFPFDLIPDVIPFLGQLDDAVIVAAAVRWFVRWCPTDVVHEHMRAIGSRPLS